jgi:cytochrome c oxidase cbb3-type subunit IV
MEINELRSAITVLSLAIFLGIVWWACSKSNSSRFNQAAQLPFDEESNHG